MNPLHIAKFSDFLMKNFKLSAFQFTMGRDSLYNMLINSGFNSSGIDSTWIYSKDIEMDLVKLLLEVGIIGILVVIIYFWKFAKANWYSYVYVCSVFFNLVTSHSFHTVTGWILRYMLLLSLFKYTSNTQAITLKKNIFRKN